MSFLPRKGKYLYSGRLSTYKPQNIQVLVRIISCVQPLFMDNASNYVKILKITKLIG